jgi:sec-independent protein translocase protein TatA
LLPSFDWQELLLVLLIALVVFGALPEIGSVIGRTIREFRTAMREATAEDSGDEPRS